MHGGDRKHEHGGAAAGKARRRGLHPMAAPRGVWWSGFLVVRSLEGCWRACGLGMGHVAPCALTEAMTLPLFSPPHVAECPHRALVALRGSCKSLRAWRGR